jgi:predicted metal-dependent phosphoesterase TrpH
MKADLHVHTNVSDGIFKPETLVKMAYKQGLKTIAITDHDTVMGIGRGLRAGRKIGITIIPGVELSAELWEQEIHILGYYIKYWQPNFKQVLKKMARARHLRVWEMYKKLRMLGIKLTWQEIIKEAGHGTLGRPHLAAVLVKYGYVNTTAAAFHDYLGKGCPAYVKRVKMSPRTAIQSILRAGGVPVLAHPVLNLGWPIQSQIDYLVSLGLAGIEVYHPSHTEFNSLQLKRLAMANGLCITGGSDYHGPNTEGIQLGSHTIDDVYINKLKNRSHY